MKASTRRFLRRLFCRASLEDEEKEAERQRALEDGHHGPPAMRAATPPPRWVPIDRDTQIYRVATPPAESFVVGSDVDDEEEEDDHRRVLGRPRSIRDSESITLVGTEGSESGRDSDEEDLDDNEKGHSLPESEDGASEDESESGASEMSTTMEMDLARFREATLMVSSMVAAGEGRMRMQQQEREAQARREQRRRPLSPANSLPGYTSDDGRPPAYEDMTHHGAAAELADSVVANGFRYMPGGTSGPPF